MNTSKENANTENPIIGTESLLKEIERLKIFIHNEINYATEQVLKKRGEIQILIASFNNDIVEEAQEMARFEQSIDEFKRILEEFPWLKINS